MNTLYPLREDVISKFHIKLFISTRKSTTQVIIVAYNKQASSGWLQKVRDEILTQRFFAPNRILVVMKQCSLSTVRTD
jgi:hypothetical protein